MKSILKAGSNQDVNWRIGSRRNGNSNTAWFCVRGRARKGIRGLRVSLGWQSLQALRS
jgi:hypothetical protein